MEARTLAGVLAGRLPRRVLPAGTCGCIHCRLPSTHLPCYRSRKRRGSETLSEEEERSSGDEHARIAQRRGRRCQGVVRRKEGRRRGEEVERHTFPKLLGRTGSPIMTECTAAMVLMDLSGSPASRVSHASGQSGKRSCSCIILVASSPNRISISKESSEKISRMHE